MAVKVIDSARPELMSRGISAPDGARGTQRVFETAFMHWLGDQIDPHITTMGRKYAPASIDGAHPDNDDTGHFLFDRRGAPVFPPSGELPAFWNDFTALKGLSPLYTFSRDSEATYIDEHGGIVTAPMDQPRFDHDPVTLEPLGLLIEPPGENVCLHSADPTQWTAGNGATIETGFDDPSGGKGAAKVNIAQQFSLADVNLAAEQTATISMSVWLWTDGEPFEVNITDNASGQRFNPVTINNTPTRYEVVSDASGVGAAVILRVVYRLTEPAGKSFYMWGPQTELGSVATSYIPTDATAKTRAADICTLDISGVDLSVQGTVFAEFHSRRPITDALWVLTGGSTTARICYTSGSATLRANDTVNGSKTYTTGLTSDVTHRTAISTDADTSLSYDGLLAADVGVCDAVRNLTTTGPLKIGMTYAAANTGQLNGHMKRLQIWGVALDDADLVALTSDAVVLST